MKNLIRLSLLSMIVSAVLPSTTLPQQSFQISSLTTSNASVIEHATVTGDDRGGIAVSSTNVFYTGDDNTGKFSLSNLSSSSSVGAQYDGMVSNLRTRQVYVLGDANGILSYGGGTVTRLIPLDGVTGAPTTGDITLSTPISITGGSPRAGIFSGWDRIVLLDGSSTLSYNIDLPSGTVTNLGNTDLPAIGLTPRRLGCENWATWGVVEYAAFEIYLVYAAAPGYSTTEIKRFEVSSGNISTIASFSPGVADLCSFTVDPYANRWYFHYEGNSGAFNFGVDENIGYADATFLGPSASPVNVSGRVTNRFGRALAGVVVKATGGDGKPKSVLTNTFGYYSLKNLKAGESYVISVESKRYYFPEPTRFLTLDADLMDLDFQAR